MKIVKKKTKAPKMKALMESVMKPKKKGLTKAMKSTGSIMASLKKNVKMGKNC